MDGKETVLQCRFGETYAIQFLALEPCPPGRGWRVSAVRLHSRVSQPRYVLRRGDLPEWRRAGIEFGTRTFFCSLPLVVGNNSWPPLADHGHAVCRANERLPCAPPVLV